MSHFRQRRCESQSWLRVCFYSHFPMAVWGQAIGDAGDLPHAYLRCYFPSLFCFLWEVWADYEWSWTVRRTKIRSMLSCKIVNRLAMLVNFRTQFLYLLPRRSAVICAVSGAVIFAPPTASSASDHRYFPFRAPCTATLPVDALSAASPAERPVHTGCATSHVCRAQNSPRNKMAKKNQKNWSIEKIILIAR